MPGSREKRRVLIVVRTYPIPAHAGVEVSCTAGVTYQGEWIRLFPVPYRMLDRDRQFAKYEWVEIEVIRASDPRPESYKIVADSIKIVSGPLPTANAWKARREILDPLVAHCLCCLKGERDEHGSPTLGLFRPAAIKRLVIKAVPSEWTHAQLEILRQTDLFGKMPARELEKIPFKFLYEFQCDHGECRGHTLSCTDWEMGQSWRSWRDKYGSEWEARFRQKYERQMIDVLDTHFFVGTVKEHPAEWIIVGLFYPPRIAATAQREFLF